MNRKVVITIVLVATIAISGCINSAIDNINQIIPELSQNIINGDKSYNEAVQYVNSHDYNTADEKIKTAITNFNDAQNKMLEIYNYVGDVNETVYLQYLELVKEELELKQNATSNLQLAIQFFKAGDNETANSYISTANSLMDQGVSIQNQRESLVKNYPEKFE